RCSREFSAAQANDTGSKLKPSATNPSHPRDRPPTGNLVASTTTSSSTQPPAAVRDECHL
ncbi:unnamed protein product, partial [Amoebophrya sp. A25]